ncbi:hypothetical protein D9M68_884830 [compost metagenome]
MLQLETLHPHFQHPLIGAHLRIGIFVTPYGPIGQRELLNLPLIVIQRARSKGIQKL